MKWTKNGQPKTIQLLLLACVMGIVSCSANGVLLPEGGYRPIENNFELAKKPFQLTQTTYVDTNSVYLRSYISGSDSIFSFYRFFSNGRVFRSRGFDHRPIDNEEINNLRSGNIGYYELRNKNEIALEVFLPDASGRPYYVTYGTAYGNTIIIDKTNDYTFFTKRIIKLNQDRITKLYRYKPSGLRLYSKPDW